MPKQSTSVQQKLANFVKTFGSEVLSTDGSILFCKICETSVNHEKKYFISQHIASGKHSAAAQKRHARGPSATTTLLKPALQAVGKESQFSLDLCDAFVSSGIPLWKLENPAIKNFIEKYTREKVPSESSIRKNYVDVVYKQRIDMIRMAVGDNYMWISIDETTDCTGRFVANIIVGTLEVEAHSKIFLLTSECLEKTNSSTIAQAFTSALSQLWPDGIKHDRVLLFVTDAATYMKKAARALKVLFPSMLYVTCLAHAFHRVAEEIRKLFPDVDELIANGKKVFLKAPSRVQTLKTIAPDLAMPPQPIITRWGTWISAALYYATNFEEFTSVMQELDETDAVSIERTKQLLDKPSVKNELCYILTHFSSLPEGITSLEEQNVPLVKALNNVKILADKMKAAPGTKGEAIKKKCESVLQSNTDLAKLQAISDVLSGDSSSSLQTEMKPVLIACMKYAPVTSVDVERSFSRLKNILSDRRESLSFENLKKMLVIQCNPV